VRTRTSKSEWSNEKLIVLLFAATLLLGIIAVVNTGGHHSFAEDVGYVDPVDKEDYVPGVNIEIDSVDKLMQIGKNSSYPLNGKYVQTKDLNFDTETFSTTDLGWKYRITASFTDTSSTGSVYFYVEENSSGIFQPLNGSNICVNFGFFSSKSVSIVNGSFTVSNNESKFDGSPTMFTMGGEKSTGTDASFSFVMEVASSGDSKEGYHLGNFKPILNFRGVYNGNGYHIVGVEMGVYVISNSVKGNVGIFGTINSATIKNVYVKDGESSGAQKTNLTSSNVGLIVGSATNNTVIDNCYADGMVGFGEHSGCIAGYTSKSTISNCTSAGTVYFTWTYGGGIVGNAETGSVILSCINLGRLIEPRAQVGGIVGILNVSEVSNVVNKGKITGGVYSGGLVGCLFSSQGEGINYGDVEGVNNAGGLVGWMIDNDLSGINYGNVSGKNTVGGLVGWAIGAATVTDSINHGNVKGTSTVGGIIGDAAGSSAVLGSINYGDVESSLGVTGGIVGSSEGRILNVANYGNVEGGTNSVGGIVGNCTRNNNPISGVNYGDVHGRENVGGIAGYVTLSKMTITATNYGNIEGSSHYVGGIVGNNSSTTYPTNLRIEDSANYGNISGAYYVGGIASYGSGPMINVINNGDVKGTNYVGGIVGYSVSPDNPWTNNGNVSGANYVGGIAGMVDAVNSTITGTNTVNVSGTGNYVGGIAGMVSKSGSTITASNVGSVSGANYVGGIAGSVARDSRIIGTTNSGNVTGSVDFVGGIVGDIGNDATIEDCNNSGNVKGRNNVGGFVGRSALGANIAGQINSNGNTGSVSGVGNIGGIVGDASGVLMSCIFNKGNVSATTSNAGGIIGTIYVTSSSVLLLEYTFNEGNVTAATFNAGGLVGNISAVMGSTGSSIHDSYSMGDISVTNSSSSVGGIVGSIANGNISIDNTYSSGIASYFSGTMYGGGIVGSSSSSGLSVTDSFFRILNGDGTDLSGNMSSLFGGTPTYNNVMKREGTYTKVGWDFTAAGVWAIDEMNKTVSSLNQGYPFFGTIVNQYYIEIVGPDVFTIPAQGMYGPVNSGNSVLVSFTPNPEYVIQNVLVDGVSDADALFDGYYLFEDIYMSHRIEIIASIPLPPPSIYVIHSSSDDNSSIDPEGAIAVNKGHHARFFFHAEPGYVIHNVIIDGVSHPELVLTGQYVFWSVSTNHTICVESSPAEEEVTFTVIIVEGEGHVEYSIEGGIFIEYVSPIVLSKSADIVFNAIPDEGYSFDRWDNYRSSPEPRIEIIVVVSGTLEVYFKEDGSGGKPLWQHGCCILLLLLLLLLLLFLLIFRRYNVFTTISGSGYEGISNVKFMPEKQSKARYRINDDDDWKPMRREKDKPFFLPEEVEDIVNIRDKVRRKTEYRFKIEGISVARYKVEKDGEWFPLQKGDDGSYEVPGEEVLGDIWIEIDG
jgi:Flagellar biosynthesis pathway, component FlhA